jgi:SAM-dependent methyltransferase
MRATSSLPPAYFEDIFASNADPWSFEASPYEQAKYAHTLAALAGRHYRCGFEIGCANGILTRKLIAHCETLLAIDVSRTALAKAKARCSEVERVRFAQMAFPREGPNGDRFDLIVLSEVAYFWDDTDLELAADRLSELLAPGGDLILVHWTGETDYPQSGDGAVVALRSALSIHVETLREESTPDYRLDLWRRTA